MKIYKDSFKTVLLTALGIVAIGVVGFLVGSYLLAPKSKDSSKATYKAKANYPSDNIKLSYWRTVDGTDVFKPMLEKWQSYHPNVSVEITNIPSVEYDKALSEAASKGSLPDLFMMKSDWLPRYKGYLKTAPKEIFNIEEYKKTFAPVVSKDLILNNEIYAVSYGVPTLGLFYNSDKFTTAGISSAPADWNALLDANSKLVKKQGNGLLESGIALGTPNVSAAASTMPLLMMQNGAAMTDIPPTKATFQNPDSSGYPGSTKALDFYTSFARPNKSSFSWSDGFGDSVSAFSQGKTAMIIDYPFRYGQIKAQSPSLNYKTAKVPQVNTSSPVNYTEFWAEGVNKDTPYPEIAWDFYNFMTSYEIMNMYSVPTLKPASRLDLAKAQEQDSVIGPFAAQVPTAQDYYKGNNASTDAAILEMINIALSGYDSAIAVKGAAQKVTESIRQFPY
jgi:multiple sugar transport system substrate-binding protein